jgi:hypothetical protein
MGTFTNPLSDQREYLLTIWRQLSQQEYVFIKILVKFSLINRNTLEGRGSKFLKSVKMNQDSIDTNQILISCVKYT